MEVFSVLVITLLFGGQAILGNGDLLLGGRFLEGLGGEPGQAGEGGDPGQPVEGGDSGQPGQDGQQGQLGIDGYNSNAHHRHGHTHTDTCGCVHGTCSIMDWHGQRSEFCNCDPGYSGDKCDDDACDPNPCPNGETCSRHSGPLYTCTGDQTKTTITTTVAPTTMPQNYSTCSKWSAVSQIADEVTVTHTNAHVCPTGSTASPEAFVIVHCHVSVSSSWSRGANVFDHCSDIPLYTPVAAFSGDGQYDGHTAWSGIFVGCLTDGFRLAHQLCDQPANFTHVVSGGTGNLDPTVYYTIQ